MFPDLKIDWEQASYIATVVAAIPVGLYFVDQYNQRKADRAEDAEKNRIEREENYSRLQAEYRKTQFWLADHPEINMHSEAFLNPVLAERQTIFYSNLVSLLEESFLLFYEPDDPDYARMWHSWDDYMNELLAWPNFRRALPELLKGEDEEFVEYITQKLEKRDAAPAPEMA